MSPCRLFMLGDVPEDEADEIRELLAENEFDCFEVPAGFLGLTPASIWLRKAEDYPRARELLDHYQQARAVRARTERKTTFLQHFGAHPFRTSIYVALIAIVIYFSLSPFLNLGK